MGIDNIDERSDSVDERSDFDERSLIESDIGNSLADYAPAVRAAEPTVVNNVYLSLAYEDTDFTRQYKFTDVSNEALSSVASKVTAYNANVPVADKSVFVSDEGDLMSSISSATIEIVTTEYIIKR